MKLTRIYPYTADELKLLKRLPKKYHERFRDLSREDDLIDNCRYMLYLADGFSWGEYDSIPVKSITEAIAFIKDSWKAK